MSPFRGSGDRPANAADGEDGEVVPAGEPRVELSFHAGETGRLRPDLTEENVTMDAESVVELPDDTLLVYWTVRGGEAGPFLDALEELPTTLDARLLSSVGGRHRVEVHAPADSLNSTVREFDGAIRSLTIGEEEVRLVAEFPRDVDGKALTDRIEEVYPELELVSMRHVVTPRDVRRLLQDDLTTRQQTALRLAYYGGYFEQPRLSTGEELAARMGVSKQTFHEHLRKAYAAVFDRLFSAGGDADDP